MLVDENRIAVRIDQHEARRPGAALVGFVRELEPLRLEAALVLAHVGELLDCLSLVVPPWVEGEDVALEHALEQPEDRLKRSFIPRLARDFPTL